MAKIICTKEEYDKLSTVIEDNPQFLANVSIDYEIINPRCKDIRLGNSPLGLLCSECPCNVNHYCNGECFEHIC